MCGSYYVAAVDRCYDLLERSGCIGAVVPAAKKSGARPRIFSRGCGEGKTLLRCTRIRQPPDPSCVSNSNARMASSVGSVSSPRKPCSTPPRNAAVAFSMFTLCRTARSTSSSALIEATKWRFEEIQRRLPCRFRQIFAILKNTPGATTLESINETPSLRDRSFLLDAHRGDGKDFVVRADEKVSAFLELEAAVRGCTM